MEGPKKRIGEYLSVKLWPRKPEHKTDRWGLYGARNKTYLGHIEWYSPWRQYVFYPDPAHDPIFNRTCLNDISNFLREEMEKRL